MYFLVYWEDRPMTGEFISEGGGGEGLKTEGRISEGAYDRMYFFVYR